MANPQWFGWGHNEWDAYSVFCYYTTQATKNNCVTMLPVVVGPILYCFFILWHNQRTKHIQYFFQDSQYHPEIIDYYTAHHGAPDNGFTTEAPPVSGSAVWENELSGTAGSLDNSFWWLSVVVKAGVYTEELLAAAKAAVDSADAAAIYDIVDGLTYVDAPYYGYPAYDWMGDIPGLTMQTKLTERFTSDYWGDSLDIAYNFEDMLPKVRPHTKAELQATGLWPQES